jgi:hypothetical protein
MPRKMGENWANFVKNFNKSSWYSMKFFSVINFQFKKNFISFWFGYDQNLSLHQYITVAYLIVSSIVSKFLVLA